MNSDIYRYEFSPNIPIQDVETTLALSVLTTESLHGRSRVRMDAAFFVEQEQHACVVDGGTDVGRDIARIFTGFLSREFGEESFKVKRIAQDSASCGAAKETPTVRSKTV